jgi:hypothetical protein
MQTAQQNYTRQGDTLVNNDLAAYRAAKLRKQREMHIFRLEERINNLEECVKRLEQTIEEINK